MKGCRPFSQDESDAIVARLAGGQFGRRDVALFCLGIQTGFRISELLSIRLRDLIQDGKLVDRLSVSRRFMKKKKASRSVILTSATRDVLSTWLSELRDLGYMAPDDYVFQSGAGSNKAISRVRAYQIIHAAARAEGLTGTIGTHSLRKTFADRLYATFLDRQENGIDALRTMSKALGHANINNTDKYLSFREEEIDDAIVAVFGK